jgi:RNA polymerase sigma-B factor
MRASILPAGTAAAAGRQPRVGPGSSGAHDRHDRDFAELERLLTRFASLEPRDPRRPALRQELVSGYLPLARHIARTFANRGEPFEDLVQIATLGLILAVDRFDPRYGSGFLAFAVPTIRGEVQRHFRDRCWSLRVTRHLKDLHLAINAAISELSQVLGQAPRPSQIAQLLGISHAEVLEGLRVAAAYRAGSLDAAPSRDPEGEATLAEQIGEPDPAFELVEDKHALGPLLEELPERERAILMMRFYANMTQTQIAARLGLSQMHVSRLLSATLARLRRRLLDEEQNA